MFRRNPIGVALTVVALFTAAASAVAGGPAASASTGGAIDARGTGIAELRGAIDASITARYPVMLTRDFAGDGTITVPGSTDRVSFLGFTVYFSAQSAHISGTDVEIAVIGDQIQAKASGTGVAYVKGTGSYSIDGRASKAWSADIGSAVAFGAQRSGGTGLFAAHGLGVVAVRGTIEYRGGASAGILLVKDVAGGATVHVTGGERGEFLGLDAYTGFTSAEISGADVGVVVTGVDVNVMATGTGLAYMQGIGAYSTNNEASAAWTIAGQFAEIAP